MFTKTFFTMGALAMAASAIPMGGKRDVVYVTQTSKVIETVAVTHTVWVDPHPTRARHGHGHNRNNRPSAVEETTAEPTTEAVVEPTSSVESTSSVYVAPTPSVPEAIETTTAVEVAPTPETTEEAETTPVYVAPTPEEPTPDTTEEEVAPVTTEEPTSIAPATTYEAPAAETSPSTNQNSAAGGDVHTGDITYYAPGLGSCGETHSSSDNIVALSHVIMTPQNGGNPNNNPLCGSTITIEYNGNTHQAEVVDTCPGCSEDSIDLSPSLFQAVAPNGDGRVSGVSWWFN